MIMARVNPQKAGANTQPVSSLVKWNWLPHTPSSDARNAKVREVKMRATQLAVNNTDGRTLLVEFI
jgi:hypothetical protein